MSPALFNVLACPTCGLRPQRSGVEESRHVSRPRLTRSECKLHLRGKDSKLTQFQTPLLVSDESQRRHKGQTSNCTRTHADTHAGIHFMVQLGFCNLRRLLALLSPLLCLVLVRGRYPTRAIILVWD
ncbi:hypothetical protein AAMO2058_000210900 [Amorphochlora amoebiformis]